MEIIDLIIIFAGAVVLFWLFTVLVINPINKTVKEISSKNKDEERLLQEIEKHFADDR